MAEVAYINTNIFKSWSGWKCTVNLSKEPGTCWSDNVSRLRLRN